MKPITRRILPLFLAVGLIMGGGVVVDTTTAEPASAHLWDNYAHYYCAKHRSGPEQTIVHAVPDYYDVNYIRYYCRQDFFGVSHQYWVQAWHPIQNNISARPWAYQKCWPSPGWLIVCEEP